MQIIYNYFDHNPNAISEYLESAKTIIGQEEYSFLNTHFVNAAFSATAGSRMELYAIIQQFKDDLLSRENSYTLNVVHELFFEKSSEYADGIANVQANIANLITFCKGEYSKIQEDKIFYSLKRGVAVLTLKEQLLAYMYSFGDMHYHKMLSALIDLENDGLNDKNEVEVYDWGCGQGIASVVLLERLPSISPKVTLIEPSKIALERAALHVNWMRNDVLIETILKDIDSVLFEDFRSSVQANRIHLFSNILDVTFFNLEQPYFIN